MEPAEGLRAATCGLLIPEIACASCFPSAQAQASTSVGPEEPSMEHPLIIAVLLVMGFYLGLLVMRVFGAPGDGERLKDASVRLQREAPSRR